jgi:hypothetical protein
MSVRTEFFIATEQEFDALFADWVPPGTPTKTDGEFQEPNLLSLAGVQLRGISSAELLTLHQAALNADAADLLRPIRMAPQGRPRWIHKLPVALVSTIAKLTAEELTQVGEKWANLERDRINAIKDPYVHRARVAHHRVRLWQDTLEELAMLAGVATERAADLYMYLRH